MKLNQTLVVLLASVLMAAAARPSAEPVAVRHMEGLVHGFLTLHAPDGKLIANGDLIQNVQHTAFPETLSLVVATPKPRLVKVKLSVAGLETFSTGTQPRRATHYVLKVDIGGLTGLVAPLIGKQPPDSHVWILEGDAPAFVKSDAQA